MPSFVDAIFCGVFCLGSCRGLFAVGAWVLMPDHFLLVVVPVFPGAGAGVFFDGEFDPGSG